MNTIFIGLLNMSITGGVAILAVLALRFFLRRAPKLISYCLWAVVLFRLLCPISFSLPFSLLSVIDAPATERGTVNYIPEELLPSSQQWNGNANSAPAWADNMAQGTMEGIFSTGDTVPAQGQELVLEQSFAEDQSLGKGYSILQHLIPVLPVIWAAGVAILLVYSGISLALLLGRLRHSSPMPVPAGMDIRWQGRLYQCSSLSTAFVLGLIRPRIYLPKGLSQDEMSCILLHEQIHIRRRDSLVKLVSWLVVCLHWFNPLVWAAFLLSGEDMEMACDEAVLRRLGDGIKKQYSASLLNMSVGRRILGGVPLAFGEGDTGSRIRNVLRYKKPGVVLVCAACVVAVVFAVFFLANPRENGSEPSGGEEQYTSSNGADESQTDILQDPSDDAERELELIRNELRRILNFIIEQNIQQSHVEAVRLQEMERGEPLTWDVLKELQELIRSTPNKLELYAGYDDAVWGDREDYNYLEYFLKDETSEDEYRLSVSYATYTNDVHSVQLTRVSDSSGLLLYRVGTNSAVFYRTAEEIDEFLSYIPDLSD